MLMFVHELSQQPIKTSASRRNSLQDGDVSIGYNKDFEINYNAETKLFDEECRIFINKFVEQIFETEGYFSQEDKAKFGLLVQHQEGRKWFARLIDSQRVKCKEVSEFTFYRLIQYFAVCLFECNVSDDFSPAITLLNMCFTYHFTSTNAFGRAAGQSSKQFVYEYLKEQPIWKSFRFWNSGFLMAIHADRTKRVGGMSGWNNWDQQQKDDFEICEENSTFAHLASFLYMMSALGVSKKDREEFRNKMSTIGNLREEQIRELEESVEILQ